jgi:hypothetical protein
MNWTPKDLIVIPVTMLGFAALFTYPFQTITVLIILYAIVGEK